MWETSLYFFQQITADIRASLRLYSDYIAEIHRIVIYKFEGRSQLVFLRGLQAEYHRRGIQFPYEAQLAVAASSPSSSEYGSEEEFSD